MEKVCEKGWEGKRRGEKEGEGKREASLHLQLLALLVELAEAQAESRLCRLVRGDGRYRRLDLPKKARGGFTCKQLGT